MKLYMYNIIKKNILEKSFNSKKSFKPFIDSYVEVFM